MIDLAKSQAICDAASPAPWPRDFGRYDYPNEGAMAVGPPIPEDDGGEDLQAQADQDFLAHARTALPEALEEIRLLRDELEAARAVVEEARWVAERCTTIGPEHLHDSLVCKGCRMSARLAAYDAAVRETK